MAESESAPDPTTEPATAKSNSGLVILLLAMAAVLAVCWSSLVEMATIWELDPNYSHGFIVPIVSIALAARVLWKEPFAAPKKVEGNSILIGVCSCLLGGVLHAYGWLISNLVIDVVGMIFMLRGAVYLVGGKPLIKQLGFPILFLIFMAPLPIAWYQPFALAMQNLVSVVSANVLEAFGAAVYREGYIIQLPEYRMEVGEACSGLRQLTAVLALAVGIGYLTGRGARYRWTLGILSIPIAIGANCIRVILTGVILMWFGPEWAEGVFHTLEGMVMVGVAAALTVVVARMLERLDDMMMKKPQAPEYVGEQVADTAG